MKNKLDIGITLRKYRYTKNYTQQTAADLLEISRAAYKKWENNKIDFAISQLSKIANLYELPIDIIIQDSYIGHKSLKQE
jgi:transcriptional regulator with XRE-family HTH domain